MLGSSGPHTVSFFKELRTWEEQEMGTETFLAYTGRKGSPGILGTPRKMDLNPFCGIGSVLGVNLWRDVCYQKAS